MQDLFHNRVPQTVVMASSAEVQIYRQPMVLAIDGLAEVFWVWFAQEVQIRLGQTAKADQWAAASEQFLKALNKFHPKRVKRNQWDAVLRKSEAKS